VARATSGCNAEISTTFLTRGSLLENVGGRMGIPRDHIDLIRGLVGDVKLEGPTNAYKVSYETPCPENNPDDIKSFANGDVYAKSANGLCRQITDANRDLVRYVSDTLNRIANKIESKAALSPA
jgi:conjugative transfer pilus assembly protein TraH